MKYCLKCKKIIPEPSSSATSDFAKYWRDNRCYRCGNLLSTAEGQSNANSKKKPDSAVSGSHNWVSDPPGTWFPISIIGALVLIALVFLYITQWSGSARAKSATTPTGGGLMKAPKGGHAGMKGPKGPGDAAVPVAVPQLPDLGCKRGSSPRPNRWCSRSTLVPRNAGP
jgi:hypothetical protein